MILTKTTVGFVTQRFDTETGKWIDQKFISGDDVTWEDEDANTVEAPDSYLSFNMIQPINELSAEDKEKYDKLLGSYVQVLVDELDMNDVSYMAYEYIEQNCKLLTMDELIKDIREYHPELLN